MGKNRKKIKKIWNGEQGGKRGKERLKYVLEKEEREIGGGK